MDIDINSLVELAKVAAPISATVITYFHTQKTAKKHAAKQSILQMIMEDQLNWELFRKFPTNYGNIQDEYEVYHKCGGNGEVTKKVKEYNDWYEANEKQMKEMASMNCKPEVTITCNAGK